MRWIIGLFVCRSHVIWFRFIWVWRRRRRRVIVRLLRIIGICLRWIGFCRTVALILGLIGVGIGRLRGRVRVWLRFLRVVLIVVVDRVHNGWVGIGHRMTQLIHLFTWFIFHVFWGMCRTNIRWIMAFDWIIRLTWFGAVLVWGTDGWRWIGLHVWRFWRVWHPFWSTFVIVRHVFAFGSLVSRIWMRDVLELRLFITVIRNGWLVVEHWHWLLNWLSIVCRFQC